MLTENQLSALPLKVQGYFRQLEADIIAKICSHIGKIVALTPTDIYRLDELQNIGYDLQAIQSDIADTLNRSTAEIHDIFTKASAIEYEDGVKAYFDLTGNSFTPFNENIQLQTIIQSIESATISTFQNISSTTAIGLSDRFCKIIPLSQSYQSAVDYAILQMRTGQTDFYSAMRQTIKSFSDSGLRTVDYSSGYSRRIDSSVRSAILGGQARLSNAQADLTGQVFGYNGYEITYHSGHRPSHWFGGRQFTFEEFDKQGIGALMDETNCYHRKFPIIIGISQPAYTQEQLDAFEASENMLHDFNGKQYNRYEASQKQRQYETAIRRKKDEANAYSALAKGYIEGGGNKSDNLYKQYKDTATLAKAKSQAINQEYAKFSNAMSISTQPKRASVPRVNK